MRPVPRPLGASVLVVAAGLMTSCATTPKSAVTFSPPSLSSVVRGRFTSRVELDDGELLVVPPGRRTAHVSLQSAQALFQAADVVDGSYRFAVLGLGVVTLSSQASAPNGTGSGSTTTNDGVTATGGVDTTGGATTTSGGPTTTGVTAPPGVTVTTGTTGTTGTAPATSTLLPRYEDRLAWVGIAWGAGCSGASANAPPPTRYVAVVIDARTGHSVLAYTSRSAPPCGGAIQPASVTRPTELVSVPWQPVGPASTSVRVTLPPCATFFGWTDVTGPGPASIQVVAQKPFDPDCGSSAPTVQVVASVVPVGKAQAQIPHAVLGPVDVLQTLAGG